jgi:hypothetical protein
VELDIENNNILDWRFKKIELPLELEEDRYIKRMIPSCFQDSDCPKKDGLVAKCNDAGKDAAVCTYYEVAKIEATLVTDKECRLCSTALSENFLKKTFLGIDFKRLDYREDAAKELIKEYGITTLPCFILPSQVKEEKKFSKLGGRFREIKGKIILQPELSGVFLFLDRKEIKNRIDFFLDMFDKNAADVLKALIEFSTTNNIKLNIHFIVSPKVKYGYPHEEIKAALAIREVYPDKFNRYLNLRINNIRKVSWVNSLEELKGEYEKIRGLLKSQLISRLLEENSKLARELGVRDGNVILVNNRMIFKIYKVDIKALRELFD